MMPLKGIEGTFTPSLQEIFLNIEDFSSCLNYVQAMPAKKDTFDILLPVATTAIGVLLGFGINYYRDRAKENKTTANKLVCIKEEIHRIHTNLEHVFSECISLHEKLITEEEFIGHSLPGRIDSFFIDENFISIAHELTTEERNYFSNLLSLLSKQNEHLKSMHETFNPKKLEHWQNNSLNTLNNALFCVRKCRTLMNNGQKTDLSLVDLADELNITSTFIEYNRNHIKNKGTAI